MEYLYSNVNELNYADKVAIHCNNSFFPAGNLPSKYVKDLISQEAVKPGSYNDLVIQLSNKVGVDYHTFDRLSKLSQLLFSTYELDNGTLHLFPDELMWHSAYETIRERLDEIAFSN